MNTTSTADSSTPDKDRSSSTPNRWVILLGGILVQLAIGAVYA